MSTANHTDKLHDPPNGAARDPAPVRPAGAMIDPDEALRLVLEAAAPLAPRDVPLGEACGLRLAQEVRADRDYPAFDRAMMDGYAVRSADGGRSVAVTGEVRAGMVSPVSVVEGRCLEIMTGAPCPAGADAVVPKEHARREGDRVQLPRAIAPGHHIAPQGSECPADRVVLVPGQTVTPLAVAVMASFGLRSVRVVPRPVLGTITTGSELVRADAEPGPAQIRDSNGPMLSAMTVDLGLARPLHLHADDRPEAIVHALGTLSDRDIVLLTGGVSVGNYDLVPDALRSYGAEVLFHKVRQKPGKPLLVARKGRQLVFGLPGNPLATHLCFHRYVTAAAAKMAGSRNVRQLVTGELSGPVSPKPGRTSFVPAVAAFVAGAGRWRVRPTPGLSSADIFGSCRANCYLHVPPGSAAVAAGECLAFSWIAGTAWPIACEQERPADLL